MFRINETGIRSEAIEEIRKNLEKPDSSLKESLVQLLDIELGLDDEYYIFFTSSRHMSNYLLISGVIKSFLKRIRKIPFIALTYLEQDHIIKLLESHKLSKECVPKFIPVNQYFTERPGTIDEYDIHKKIEHNVALLIAPVIPDLGYINEIKTIVSIAHEKKTPVHVDATNVFGKIKSFRPKDLGIDSFTASFSSINGPEISILAVKKNFYIGYNLDINITYDNIPYIAGSISTLTDRENILPHLLKIQKFCKELLEEKFKIFHLKDITQGYLDSIDGVTEPEEGYEGNKDLDRKLRKKKIFMTILNSEICIIDRIVLAIVNSAYNSSELVRIGNDNGFHFDKAEEYMLKAMRFPHYVVENTIIITFSLTSTETDVKKLIKFFVDLL